MKAVTGAQATETLVFAGWRHIVTRRERLSHYLQVEAAEVEEETKPNQQQPDTTE